MPAAGREHRRRRRRRLVAKTCGGPNEIVECRPPVETPPDSATETEAQPTCGGPGDIIECAPPVESEPRGDPAVRQA